MLFKGAEAVTEGLPDGVVGPMIVGTIASAVSGYLAIACLLTLCARRPTRPSSIYRLVVGVAVLLIIATGLQPGDVLSTVAGRARAKSPQTRKGHGLRPRALTREESREGGQSGASAARRR